ncbi:MAG: choice-of-anchor L domain-containing protein [Nonlabens sp.]|uniref:choice-of-anchor L domain-containing protein n=1 Tax=Nonlabens sp. TaxID=1888209 RepID=UPI003EF3EC14
MKRKQLRILLPIAILLLSFSATAQLITTTTGATADQLVRQALDNDCVTISNVTSPVNGSINGLGSFGSFDRAGSAFPFNDGFFITSGNALSAGNNTIVPDLNEGSTTWTGDADLENALGITNTLNATVIEFDLVSVTDAISFNYLMASEEYQMDFPCNVADGFALLIRPTGSTAPYQNMAVIPGTNIPVGIDTVHPEVVGQCPEENVAFFGGTQIGDTNYEGRTVSFTASAPVIPNQSYHLKMVVADQFDFRFDTAVFIESGSLRAEVDLGPDLLVCTDTTLDADTGNPLATYEWFDNSVPIPGATGSTLFVDSTATYTVEVTIPGTGNNCVITDSVIITVDPNQLSTNLPDFSLCDDDTNDGIENFDLLSHGNSIINTLPPSTYNFDFYANFNDAQNELNALPASYTNISNPETIYFRVNDTDSGCQGISILNLVVNPIADAMDYTYEVCDRNYDGFTPVNLAPIDVEVTTSTTSTITYHLTMMDVVNNTNPLSTNYVNNSNPETIFARITDPVTGCYNTSNVNIIVNVPPVLNSPLELIDGCDADGDGFATFDLTSVETDFTGGQSNIMVTYHTSQMDADDGTNPIPNPNAFNNTVNRIQTVYIRVVDSVNGCPSTGNITLYSNLLLDATNIQDFDLCDDITNDGIENFALDDMEITMINGLEMVEIQFYETMADQQADINRLDKTVGYANMTNPQTLWIRITSPDCVEFAEIEIEVLPFFESDPIPNQTYCDEDQDLVTAVDLTVFDDAARGMLPTNFPVRYFISQQDADDGNSPINTIVNTTNPFDVYVQVTNLDGCSDVHPMQITILPAPVAADPSPYIICDNDQDGFFIIDLTSKENEITIDPDRTITYHNSIADAESGSNSISGTTSYNAQTETVYVRVLDDLNGCPTIVQQSITISTIPVFPVITIYNVCETDGDNTESFLLSTKDNEILNGQAGKVVSYHLTPAEASSNSNPIDKNVGYMNISTPQTIYVRVENISDPTCFDTDSFNLEVNDAPTYNAPTDLTVCDDNNDGISTFDLQPTIDEIRNGISSNLTINFFENTIDAEANLNSLPLVYTNTVNPQTIIARIGNDALCYELESFELNVVDAPTVLTVNPSVECDEDYDGITTFDLSFRESDITGTRPFNSIVTWHTDPMDAENGVNPIPDSTNFTNTSNPQTVYLRLYNTVSDCYIVGTLDLEVNLPPAFTPVASYRFCDNPTMEVDLNEVTSNFINPLPGNNMVTYYDNALDAADGINSLPTPYVYTANSTTIFTRLENTTTGCFFVTDFDLQIQPSPILPAAGTYDLVLCDDDYDGLLIVDVTDNEAATLGSLNPANHTVQYYFSQADAENQTNEIVGNITAVDGTQIFTLVTETILGCTSIGNFDIIVNPLPVPPIDRHYVICDIFVTVDAATGAAGETYLWSNGATSSSIDITVPGDYTVVITSAEGCSSPAARFLVTQSSSAMLDFILKVDFADPNSIIVIVSGDGDYLYVLDNGEPQRSNVFPDVTRGYHDVVVIDINGCDPTPPQRVLIIDYPKFFTPNSDNFNDFWQVDDIETFDDATFAIFDRHGKLLKTFDKDSQGWDGMYNGNPLPSSDYWFLLEIKDSRGDFDVRGHFSLKR